MSTRLPQTNYTQVPNLFFELMPEMEDTELRVMLFAIRQIVGWHKPADRPECISVSDFVAGTGLSKNGVRTGIDAAVERGWLAQIVSCGPRGENGYILVFEKRVQPLNQGVQPLNPSNATIAPVPVQPLHQSHEENEGAEKKEINLLNKEETAPAENGAVSSQPLGSSATPVSPQGTAMVVNNPFNDFPYTLEEAQRIDIAGEKPADNGKNPDGAGSVFIDRLEAFSNKKLSQTLRKKALKKIIIRRPNEPELHFGTVDDMMDVPGFKEFVEWRLSAYLAKEETSKLDIIIGDIQNFDRNKQGGQPGWLAWKDKHPEFCAPPPEEASQPLHQRHYQAELPIAPRVEFGWVDENGVMHYGLE